MTVSSYVLMLDATGGRAAKIEDGQVVADYRVDPPSCTCKAGQFRTPCKHVNAVQKYRGPARVVPVDRAREITREVLCKLRDLPGVTQAEVLEADKADEFVKRVELDVFVDERGRSFPFHALYEGLLFTVNVLFCVQWEADDVC